MLDLSFFRNRRFSGAIASLGLVTFALFGALFVLTQFLQSELGSDAASGRGGRSAAPPLGLRLVTGGIGHDGAG